MHVLIAFAFSDDPGCRAALDGLPLPHLTQLLRHMAPVDSVQGDASSWSPPHERVLARALGLDDRDGHIPWAAWQATQAGEPPGTACAWITPASWQVARDHILMSDPQQLHLNAAQAGTLLEAMRPFFEEDGITLTLDTPARWLARGEVFRDLPSASLDRVAGRDIAAWMPAATQATTLRRLQSEMQMLLYTHPLTDARQQQGLPPVNSFWVSGAGALPEGWQPAAAEAPLTPRGLVQPALRGDWPAWRQAWQALDAQECRQLLQQTEQGHAATLTLCGERQARTWQPARQGWLAKLASSWRQPTLLSQLEAL